MRRVFQASFVSRITLQGRAFQGGVRLALFLIVASVSMTLMSCGGEKADVVLYCALDQTFSEPLIQEFEKQTGYRVNVEFDLEASKSVGLAKRIIEEKGKVRCDVFWNNEIMNTLRLKKAQMLEAYDSPNASDIPAAYRDPDHQWTGFAARARVLIVNTEIIGDTMPTSMWDLAKEEFRGKCGIAKPLFGTTATHFTALFDILGDEKAVEFFDALVANDIKVTTGNAHLMREVSAGNFAWGFTDTDDYNVARLKGHPVEVIYPDSGENDLGTMLIPNTVCLIKGAPHQEVAKKLIDFILSRDVEKRLAFSRSAQIPVRDAVERPDFVIGASDFKVMEVDFEKAALNYDVRRDILEKKFVR